MSVTAGIPDFRSKGTGLYSQLEKYNLPQPESVFDISFFKKNPKPFYVLSKAFLDDKVHYTVNHHFIAECHRQGMLMLNFTQNIDGLDLKAGLPAEKVIEAHGHYRTAHCTLCNKEHDVEKFNSAVRQDEILVCNINKCEGYVKPDIVFFGEALPGNFFMNAKAVSQADLVIIMGTSLKVFPFAAMVDLIEESTPIVIINRSNPGFSRDENFLFISGNMDDNIEEIMKECGWQVPKIERTLPDTEFIKNLPEKSKLFQTEESKQESRKSDSGASAKKEV